MHEIFTRVHIEIVRYFQLVFGNIFYFEFDYLLSIGLTKLLAKFASLDMTILDTVIQS